MVQRLRQRQQRRAALVQRLAALVGGALGLVAVGIALVNRRPRTA